MKAPVAILTKVIVLNINATRLMEDIMANIIIAGIILGPNSCI